MLGNTLLACWWMASNFVLYYSIWSLFATHLQQDLKLTAMGTAVPFMLANILSFSGCVLGLDSRHYRPPLGDDHPGGDRDSDRAALSVHQRDSGSSLALACRALSAALFIANSRATSPSGSPPKCGQRRVLSATTRARSLAVGGSGFGVLRSEFQSGLCHSDAGRHRRRSRQRRRLAAAEPRDQGQGSRRRTLRGLRFRGAGLPPVVAPATTAGKPPAPPLTGG